MWKTGHISKLCKAECELCGKTSHITEKYYKNFKYKKYEKKGHTRKFCREEIRSVNYINDEEESLEDKYYVITNDKKSYI